MVLLKLKKALVLSIPVFILSSCVPLDQENIVQTQSRSRYFDPVFIEDPVEYDRIPRDKNYIKHFNHLPQNISSIRIGVVEVKGAIDGSKNDCIDKAKQVAGNKGGDFIILEEFCTNSYGLWPRATFSIWVYTY